MHPDTNLPCGPRYEAARNHGDPLWYKGPGGGGADRQGVQLAVVSGMGLVLDMAGPAYQATPARRLGPRGLS